MTEKDPNILIGLLEGMNATRWMLLGIVFLAIELGTGTTYILWVAAAAILMALITFLLPLSWSVQFILFFVLTVALLIAGHIFIRPKVKGGEPSDLNDRARAMVGMRVSAVSDFEIGKGRVKVGDTQWAAAMAEGNAKAGDELRVLSVVGATLQVEII